MQLKTKIQELRVIIISNQSYIIREILGTTVPIFPQGVIPAQAGNQ
jgi:hypothetical protein